MRRFLLVLVLTAAALFVPSPPHASACSCMTYDVRKRLPEVDGAFVGRLIARDEPTPVAGGFSSATLVRYRYHVEQPVKGDIPSGTIEVWASHSGASCGLETPVGERAGLLLDRDGSRWTSGLCYQADPDVLIRAAQPLPPPDGEPPPAVLIGTTHGPGRMVSLDRSGRIVAYGDGNGTATDIAFCPGGEMVAEAYTSPGAHSYYRPGIATRSVTDLRVAWERFLTPEEQPGYTSVADVACPDRHAGEVLALTVEETSTETQVHRTGRILAFTRSGEPRLIWTGAATGGIFSADGKAAYVTGGADGRDLLHVGLDGDHPGVRSIVRLPVAPGPIALAPGERHLAGATSPNWTSADPAPAAKAVVVDLRASPPTVAETRIGGSAGNYNSVLWSGTDRVVFVPSWNESPVRIFDAALTEVGSWSGWGSSQATVAGDRLVGLVGPKVITAPLTTGPPAGWADLESGVPGAIAAVPDGAPIGSPAEPPPTTTSTTSADQGSQSELAVASLPGDGGGSTGGRPLLAGGAGAALLAATAGGLLRRRRVPRLPQL